MPLLQHISLSYSHKAFSSNRHVYTDVSCARSSSFRIYSQTFNYVISCRLSNAASCTTAKLSAVPDPMRYISCQPHNIRVSLLIRDPHFSAFLVPGMRGQNDNLSIQHMVCFKTLRPAVTSLPCNGYLVSAEYLATSWSTKRQLWAMRQLLLYMCILEEMTLQALCGE